MRTTLVQKQSIKDAQCVPPVRGCSALPTSERFAKAAAAADVVILTRGRRGRGAEPAARNALRDTPLDPERTCGVSMRAVLLIRPAICSRRHRHTTVMLPAAESAPVIELVA